MRVVIQRVSNASVSVNNDVKGSIGSGMLILFAVEVGEGDEDIDWLVSKISNLRIFNDADGVMNRSLIDINGEADRKSVV